MMEQDFVDDYETIEDTLNCLIDELKTKELKEYTRELLASFQSEFEELYEEKQTILDKEFEEEKKEEEKQYWKSQF